MGVGAPFGNQNASKAKRWEAALERAFAAWPEKPDMTDCNALMIGLNNAAHAFVSQLYATKDIAFFKETGDRFDGKATQSIDANVKEFVYNAPPMDENL